ncbi:hypothetical protein [Pedobacter zeae]|nr:hypothetical protein [Pedobacter zeae]MBB4106659.1 hypothetical protein [Pedobacter zeae]
MKNTGPQLPADQLADIVGCSVSTVKKVRTNKRSDETVTGLKVKVFDELYEAGTTELISHIKQIVKI